LRDQRVAARLSLRQLSDLAGISNPYLSQIERGLKKPSADILKRIAHGLSMSAESLYIRAGILDEGSERSATPAVLDAIAADPLLTPQQRGVLVEVYRAFVNRAPDQAPEASRPTPTSPATPEPTPTAQARETARRPHRG
jgi:transcriptional regulator with XRE-family HTH domain